MKISIVTLFFILMAWGLGAQEKDKNKYEEIHAQKVAFVTEKIGLTVEEAQKFWPIYNTYWDQVWDLKKSQGRLDESELTEDNAREYLMTKLEIDEKKLKLRSEFYNDISRVISFKRVYLLERAEDEFRHKLLERFRRARDKN